MSKEKQKAEHDGVLCQQLHRGDSGSSAHAELALTTLPTTIQLHHCLEEDLSQFARKRLEASELSPSTRVPKNRSLTFAHRRTAIEEETLLFTSSPSATLVFHLEGISLHQNFGLHCVEAPVDQRRQPLPLLTRSTSLSTFLFEAFIFRCQTSTTHSHHTFSG